MIDPCIEGMVYQIILPLAILRLLRVLMPYQPPPDAAEPIIIIGD